MTLKNRKQRILKDFWHPTSGCPDPDLYSDQVGWTLPLKTESGGYTETRDVWHNLIESRGFDLAFFFLDEGAYYYLDNIDCIIYKMFPDPDWDGSYTIDRYMYYMGHNFDRENSQEVFYFTDPRQVWDDFKILGHDMAYVLEHSVLSLDT